MLSPFLKYEIFLKLDGYLFLTSYNNVFDTLSIRFYFLVSVFAFLAVKSKTFCFLDDEFKKFYYSDSKFERFSKYMYILKSNYFGFLVCQ